MLSKNSIEWKKNKIRNKKLACKKCGSEKVKKNGTNLGKQSYQCKECGKTFLIQSLNRVKQKVTLMYLNDVEIRKTAIFIGYSRAAVLKWVKES